MTVIERTDSNYEKVVTEIVTTLTKAIHASKAEMDRVRKQAALLAQKAEWKQFFTYYLQAYDIALKARHRR